MSPAALAATVILLALAALVVVGARGSAVPAACRGGRVMDAVLILSAALAASGAYNMLLGWRLIRLASRYDAVRAELADALQLTVEEMEMNHG